MPVSMAFFDQLRVSSMNRCNTVPSSLSSAIVEGLSLQQSNCLGEKLDDWKLVKQFDGIDRPVGVGEEEITVYPRHFGGLRRQAIECEIDQVFALPHDKEGENQEMNLVRIRLSTDL